MIRMALRSAALALLLASSAWAQEAAVTRRATELRDAPSDTGRSLAALPAQAPVTRTNERQGPWVQVRTSGGATGWLHLFDLGPASGTTTATGSGNSVVGSALRGVGSLFGGGSPKPSTTSTTAGIRGLDAQDLAQAQPDLAAVRQMEGLRAPDADVRSYAQRSAWRAVPVEPLPAPARVGGGSGDPSRNPGQPQLP